MRLGQEFRLQTKALVSRARRDTKKNTVVNMTFSIGGAAGHTLAAASAASFFFFRSSSTLSGCRELVVLQPAFFGFLITSGGAGISFGGRGTSSGGGGMSSGGGGGARDSGGGGGGVEGLSIRLGGGGGKLATAGPPLACPFMISETSSGFEL